MVILPCEGQEPARRQEGRFGYGSVWTWTALDPDTKLVASWMVGSRDGAAAKEFIGDLASRLASRVQLTTDGHNAYLTAVEDTFGADIDYAQLVKIYGNETAPEDARYSPAICMGSRKETILGTPERKHISTSHVERQNLTMRMGMRRFTRLTNGFGKKLENHIAAISLHFMYYNFCHIHQILRITPAMAAGVTDRLWSIADIVALLDVTEKAKAEANRSQRENSYSNKGPALGFKM